MIPVGLLNAGGVFSASSFNSMSMGSSIWNGIATSGSSIVAVGRAGSTIASISRSTNNGQTWSTITPSLAVGLGSVAYGAGYYIAAGDYDNSGSNGALMGSSDNGLTFTTQTLIPSSTIDIRSVIWDGSRFLAAAVGGGNARFVLSSSNGTTWTQSTDINNGNFGSRILQNGTTFLAMGDTGGSPSNHMVCTSDPTVNTNWSSFSFPGSGTQYTATGLGLFLAGNRNSATYYTSTSGTSWTTRTLPATATGGLGFANGFFWFKAVTTNVVYYSIDGINWTSTGLSAAEPGRTRIWFGNEITLLQAGSTTADGATTSGSYSL